MIVTDIAPFDNKKSRIYVDGEFAFILYRGEIRDYHLEAGGEISSPVFDEIRLQVIPKRAKLRAMNLLQKRDYTEYKLREKLREGMYTEDIIDETVEYLKSFHYIDDERYASDFIRYHIEDKSQNRIKQDLKQKGISTDIIESCLGDAYAEEDENPEIKQCRALLKKKHYDPENSTYEDRQKIMAFLYRRGFQMDVIQQVLASS